MTSWGVILPSWACGSGSLPLVEVTPFPQIHPKGHSQKDLVFHRIHQRFAEMEGFTSQCCRQFQIKHQRTSLQKFPFQPPGSKIPPSPPPCCTVLGSSALEQRTRSFPIAHAEKPALLGHQPQLLGPEGPVQPGALRRPSGLSSTLIPQALGWVPMPAPFSFRRLTRRSQAVASQADRTSSRHCVTPWEPPLGVSKLWVKGAISAMSNFFLCPCPATTLCKKKGPVVISHKVCFPLEGREMNRLYLFLKILLFFSCCFCYYY